MSGHTPGPWTVGYNENETKSVMAFGRRVIAFPVIPDVNPYHVALDISEANARLISAAPDLLDALKTTLGNIRSLKAAQAPGLETYDVWEAIVSAAIAKAEPDPQSYL